MIVILHVPCTAVLMPVSNNHCFHACNSAGSMLARLYLSKILWPTQSSCPGTQAEHGMSKDAAKRAFSTYRRRKLLSKLTIKLSPNQSL